MGVLSTSGSRADGANYYASIRSALADFVASIEETELKKT